MPEIKNNLDRAELCALVAEETSVDVDFVDRVVESLLKNIRKGISERGYVEIHELGSFKTVTRAARGGVTPKGKKYSVPERLTVKFEAFSDLRAEVETFTGTKCI